MDSTRRRPKSVIALMLAATAFIAWACSEVQLGPRAHNGCLPNNGNVNTAEFTVCAASDMAKTTRSGKIDLEHLNYDLTDSVVHLDAARNEVIAYQLILSRLKKSVEDAAVTVELGPWTMNGSPVAPDLTPVTNYFAAHYHYVDNGGYRWGPRSSVLSWPDHYPDALVPNEASCGSANAPIFESVKLSDSVDENQSVWFDVYIPRDAAVGVYNQTISLTLNNRPLDVVVEVTVHPATLPDENTINAIGEIYRAYNLEGVEGYIESPEWQAMSQCYQQLAHQHRTVFIERVVTNPNDELWDDYLQTIEPMLNGELFSSDSGYIGPGQDTPVGIWRTPWEQEINVLREKRLDNTTYEQIESNAAAWQNYVTSIGATELDYFAYIFDEVDGPDPTADPAERYEYIKDVHDEMDRVQKAIDAGAPGQPPIDLIWTSHSNPTVWEDDAELDLTGKIRLWAPNASAADVPFLKQRQESGDKIWFYHSGHPSIGVHSVNASGIEMRTWGMTAARYGFDGQFMWAVNLGSNEEPFAEPTYRPDDDRFGNGVVVYPGNQLPKIGYPATPGPMPSIRLKAWRRGLQDAELVELVRRTASDATVAAMEERLKVLIPSALSEGNETASWSQDPADWIEFRKSLLVDLQ